MCWIHIKIKMGHLLAQHGASLDRPIKFRANGAHPSLFLCRNTCIGIGSCMVGVKGEAVYVGRSVVSSPD